MTTLTTIILFWLCSVLCFFLFKAIRIIFGESNNNHQKTQEHASLDASSAFGISKGVERIVPDEEIDKLQTVELLGEDSSVEDISDEFDILSSTPEDLTKGRERIADEKVSRHHQEAVLNELPNISEEDTNSETDTSVSLGDKRIVEEALIEKEDVFEEKICDPDYVEKLRGSSAKLEDTIYFQKVKETEQYGSRAKKLSEIARELYNQKLEKLANEDY